MQCASSHFILEFKLRSISLNIGFPCELLVHIRSPETKRESPSVSYVPPTSSAVLNSLLVLPATIEKGNPYKMTIFVLAILNQTKKKIGSFELDASDYVFSMRSPVVITKRLDDCLDRSAILMLEFFWNVFNPNDAFAIQEVQRTKEREKEKDREKIAENKKSLRMRSNSPSNVKLNFNPIASDSMHGGSSESLGVNASMNSSGNQRNRSNAKLVFQSNNPNMSNSNLTQSFKTITDAQNYGTSTQIAPVVKIGGEDSKAQILKLQFHTNHLEKELEKVSTELREKSLALTALQEKKSLSGGSESKLASENQVLNEALKNAQQELKSAALSKSKMKEEIASLTSVRDKLLTDLKSKDNELQVAGKKIQALEMQIKHLEKSSPSQITSNGSTSLEGEDQVQTIAKLTSLYAEQKNQNEAYQKKIADFEKHLEEADKEITQYQRKVVELRVKVESNGKEMAAGLSNPADSKLLESRIKELEAKNFELMKSLNSLSKETDSARKRSLSSSQTELGKFGKDLSVQQLNEERRQRVEIESQFKKMKDAFTIMEKKYAEYVKKIGNVLNAVQKSKMSREEKDTFFEILY